jgi:hypothetical protein
MSEHTEMCFRTSAAYLHKLPSPRRPAGANASLAAQRVAEEYPHVGFYFCIVRRHAAPACRWHPVHLHSQCKPSHAKYAVTPATFSLFTAADVPCFSDLCHAQHLRTSCLGVQGEHGMVHAAITHAGLHQAHWRWLHTYAAQYLLLQALNMVLELASATHGNTSESPRA